MKKGEVAQVPQVPLQEVTIKKIGVLSLALISMVVNALVGLLLGILFFVFTLVWPTIVDGTVFSAYASPWSILILPVSYAVLGFVSGVLGALLYNISSKITKGIKIYS